MLPALATVLLPPVCSNAAKDQFCLSLVEQVTRNVAAPAHGVLIGEDGAPLPSGGPVGHPVWSLGLPGSRRHDVGVDPRALAHRRIERDSEQSSIQVRTLISVRIDYANSVVAAWYISRILRQFLLLPD